MTTQTPQLAGVAMAGLTVPGVVAFTTLRDRGDFNLLGVRPSAEVVGRWLALQEELGVPRFGYAKQVHGNRVVAHNDAWSGWLRIWVPPSVAGATKSGRK
ncbi:MAG: hypothetical protein ACT4P6_08030 [Gemmatimonadaceae bacterium]